MSVLRCIPSLRAVASRVHIVSGPNQHQLANRPELNFILDVENARSRSLTGGDLSRWLGVVKNGIHHRGSWLVPGWGPDSKVFMWGGLIIPRRKGVEVLQNPFHDRRH